MIKEMIMSALDTVFITGTILFILTACCLDSVSYLPAIECGISLLMMSMSVFLGSLIRKGEKNAKRTYRK